MPILASIGCARFLACCWRRIIGTAVSGIGGAVTYRLFQGPSATMLTTWQHWFASDAIGIVLVAPLVIGLAAAIRQPPPRSETIEGIAALVALAVMTGIDFAAAGALGDRGPGGIAVSNVVVACRPMPAGLSPRQARSWFPLRLFRRQSLVSGILETPDFRWPTVSCKPKPAILVVALGAYVLAALFAERRESEMRLARANMMLERERDNKLMSAQAITAAIAHEVRQPWSAIVTNSSAALRWLGRTPLILTKYGRL